MLDLSRLLLESHRVSVRRIWRSFPSRSVAIRTAAGPLGRLPIRRSSLGDAVHRARPAGPGHQAGDDARRGRPGVARIRAAGPGSGGRAGEVVKLTAQRAQGRGGMPSRRAGAGDTNAPLARRAALRGGAKGLDEIVSAGDRPLKRQTSNARCQSIRWPTLGRAEYDEPQAEGKSFRCMRGGNRPTPGRNSRGRERGARPGRLASSLAAHDLLGEGHDRRAAHLHDPAGGGGRLQHPPARRHGARHRGGARSCGPIPARFRMPAWNGHCRDLPQRARVPRALHHPAGLPLARQISISRATSPITSRSSRTATMPSGNTSAITTSRRP